MIPVIIESPFAGDVENNIRYAKLCVRDCLARGESPYASHLFFTQAGILDDTNPSERKLGMEAGFLWARFAHKIAVYTDLGVSSGMLAGIARHSALGIPVEFRTLDNWRLLL